MNKAIPLATILFVLVATGNVFSEQGVLQQCENDSQPCNALVDSPAAVWISPTSSEVQGLSIGPTGSGDTRLLLGDRGTGDRGARISFVSEDFSNGNLHFYRHPGHDGIAGIVNLGDGGFQFSNDQSGPFSFIQSHHYRLTISRNGKVGIGTYFPSSDLHIWGKDDDNAGINIEAHSSTGKIKYPYIDLAYNDQRFWRIAAHDSLSFIPCSLSTSHPIEFGNNGNVTIGGLTPNPDYKLEVLGRARFGNIINKRYVWFSDFGHEIGFTRPDYNYITAGSYGGSLHFRTSGEHIRVSIFWDGRAYYSNHAHWWYTSDSRLKKNIKPLTGALDRLAQLKPVEYEWRDELADVEGYGKGKRAGFLPKDLERSFPRWVAEGEGPKEVSRLLPKGEKAKGIQLPSDFYALLVQAINELREQNQTLRDDNKLLKDEIREIRQFLCKVHPKDPACAF